VAWLLSVAHGKQQRCGDAAVAGAKIAAYGIWRRRIGGVSASASGCGGGFGSVSARRQSIGGVRAGASLGSAAGLENIIFMASAQQLNIVACLQRIAHAHQL